MKPAMTDDEAGNDGDADLKQAEAHAVRKAGLITVAVGVHGIDAVDCADDEAGNDGDADL